ncbi:hypothetical protein Taro_050060, partial [Colocasia esculenta]|nr:hypothetical protein [Colocasia esculenta]
APDRWFSNPFLDAVRGGAVGCSSLTSWRVRGAGWFCLWALDLVEVRGGRAYGETVLLTWLLGVSRGDTWLFLPDLVELRDVGACVVRLWSHVVAPVFRELPCLGRCVPRVYFRIVLLWPDLGCGSSDSWVVAHPSGVPGRGPGGRVVTMVASFPTGSECELQKSVAVVAGCTCCEHGCGFARAAVGFVVGLCVLVGVSRRLREPTCGVAFTVVNSGEVLSEFFSVGSGGGLFWACFCRLLCYLKVEVSVVWLVAVALPSRLRCITWLLYVLGRLPRTVGCCPGENDALVVPVEVLPEPVVLLPLSVVFSLLAVCLGCVLVMVAFLSVFEFSRLRWWDFVCPHGREVGFVSHALWTLPDGSLVSAMGVWLVVLLWKCQSRLVVSPCMWKRLMLCLEVLVAIWCVALSACVSPFRLAMSRSPIGGTPGFGRGLCPGFSPSLGSECVLLCLVRAVPVELLTSACVLSAIVVLSVSRRMFDLALPCGRIVVVTTEKSCVAIKLAVVTVIQVTTGGCVGHVLVAVWAAVAVSVCSVWGTPGCSIPAVGLPANVATTKHVATSEKVSPRSDATLSRWHAGMCPRAGLPLGPSSGNAAGCLSAFSDRRRAVVSVLSGDVLVSRAMPCVPALADDPSEGFQKGCCACLCLLGLSWLQAS